MYQSRANNPRLSSWVELDSQSDFPIQNLPFGVASWENNDPRLVSRIGAFVIDLNYLHEKGFFQGIELPKDIFKSTVLNPFIELGKNTTCALRDRLSILLEDSTDYAEAQRHSETFLILEDQVQMHLPLAIGDYTDFYSSIEHATNIGKMLRDASNPLLPNWRHLPVAYHGRSSSIRVSGTPVIRPNGQTKLATAESPIFGASRNVDFELEMAFVIGKSNALGHPVTVEQAEEHIFGLMLFNDWSARDIQAWEYVPLGPFLAKNFASTVSPWIVTLEALEPFKVQGPVQDPEVLSYLQYSGALNYDIKLQVAIQPAGAEPSVICHSNFKYMYWNMCQQLAHHTVNGCNMQVGDLCASGTISGHEPNSFGSMMELSWRGTQPIDLGNGLTRGYIEDGDTVILSGYGRANGVRVGFGKASAKLLPAVQY
ncbi:MAG: fumarylacetoacetase [Saprospiraceae bacterium]